MGMDGWWSFWVDYSKPCFYELDILLMRRLLFQHFSHLLLWSISDKEVEVVGSSEAQKIKSSLGQMFPKKFVK